MFPSSTDNFWPSFEKGGSPISIHTRLHISYLIYSLYIVNSCFNLALIMYNHVIVYIYIENHWQLDLSTTLFCRGLHLISHNLLREPPFGMPSGARHLGQLAHTNLGAFRWNRCRFGAGDFASRGATQKDICSITHKKKHIFFWSFSFCLFFVVWSFSFVFWIEYSFYILFCLRGG